MIKKLFMAIVVFVVFILVVIGVLVGTLAVSDSAKQSVLSFALKAGIDKASLVKKQVQIDDHTIVYLERRAANPAADVIILLHGFTAEKTNWIRFTTHISDEFRVIALDWAAHGESTYLPSGDYRLQTQANRLKTLMDKLRIKKAHLVGNSMGGAIAADFASRFNDRVLTLTLMNAGGADNPASESAIERALREGKNLLVVKTPEDFDKTLNLSMKHPPKIPWPLKQAIAQKAADRHARFEKVFEQVHEGVTNTNTDYLTQISAPTLIMWGDSDQILDKANADIFKAAIPNSEVVIYKDVGHLPMLEVPGKSAADVVRFINAH